MLRNISISRSYSFDPFNSEALLALRLYNYVKNSMKRRNKCKILRCIFVLYIKTYFEITPNNFHID